MRLCSIASGSSGNCIYVGSEETHLLIDAGISGKRIEYGLNELGVTPKDVDGILVTHEHADHISGLGVISRRYGIPIYATAGTIYELKNCKNIGKVEEDLFHEISSDKNFVLKDLTVNPMRISHDASEPVAYRICCGDKKIAVATDLGVYDEYTVDSLSGMDALLLEANHDVKMLEVGPYPYYLKQRILGNKGHLSNENCGRLLSRILHDKLQAILLGHLSSENNLPELAYETVRIEVTLGDNPYKADDFSISVANRSQMSPVIQIV